MLAFEVLHPVLDELWPVLRVCVAGWVLQERKGFSGEEVGQDVLVHDVVAGQSFCPSRVFLAHPVVLTQLLQNGVEVGPQDLEHEGQTIEGQGELQLPDFANFERDELHFSFLE